MLSANIDYLDSCDSCGIVFNKNKIMEKQYFCNDVLYKCPLCKYSNRRLI